jgi:eukaryotic-like serine/threonine-protein kinase
MSANPPQTIGKYQIIREIARSNDIVYEGYDALMNRRVAVKELNVPSGSSSAQLEDRIKRFQREVKAAGSLAHPGIVTIYEVGEDQGRHYMAMEYLDGKTLRNELDTQGLLTPEKALLFAKEILEALAFAHKNGVVHRDIKPENIQIISSGQVKLTDFGIARLTFEPNITMDGQVFGTPSYMAPEQVMGKDVDAKTDLFSVGSVMIEMMTGQKAFQGDSVVSISYAIMNQEPQMPPSATPTVLQILQGLLQKSPAMRTTSAESALVQIDQALAELRGGQMQQLTGGFSPYMSNTGSYPASPNNQIPQPPVAYPPPIQAYPPQTYGSQPMAYGQQGYPPPQFPGGQMPGPTPGFTPLPVMMRPPSTPLFKPETKAGCARFFAILISMGLIFGVVILGVDQFAKAISKVQSGSAGTRTSGGNVSSEDRQTAALFQEEGARFIRSNRIDEAIQSFEKAIAIDPKQPAYQASLAVAYARKAVTTEDPSAQSDGWRRSAEAYAKASEIETNPDQQNNYKESAAISYTNLATSFMNAGNRAEARSAVYLGRQYAEPGSAAAAQLEQILRELS